MAQNSQRAATFVVPSNIGNGVPGGRKPPFFVNNVEASFAGRCVILLGSSHKITFILPFPQCGLARTTPQLDGSSADTSSITTEKVNVTSLTAASRSMIGSAR